MTDDADLDLVRRTFAAFARGDLAELTQCFAPDVEQWKVLDQREAILVTVAGGRITRLSEFYADPAATESFWA